jgi:murein DD-endopeptidase MepM/ murein hydrolase activator NlpD
MSVLLCVLVALPARGDTKSDLAAAKRRAAQVQSELNRATQAYQAAYARFQSTLDDIAKTRAAIDKTQKKLNRIRADLARRARDEYTRGVAGTLELLLSASSFSQFSDRVEFLNRMSQGDADLIIGAQVTQEELARQQADLEKLSAAQAAASEELGRQKAVIDAKFAEQAGLVNELERQYRSEIEAQRIIDSIRGGGIVVRGGALQSCPVDGPRSYWDDFGQPRSGGRTHQGNDILAPYGTPVAAAQSGRFESTYNSLGGTSAFVYSDGGDMTYYAHLSSYAGISSGAHVSAGTHIGAVGTSGNAAGGPPHLHFEYHPGGGAAADPYPYLRAVCG